MDEYIKSIAETADKNLIHNVPNTNADLAWYEEKGTVHPHIEADNIWADAALIPANPNDVELVNNKYIINVDAVTLPVFELIKDLELVSLANTNAFFNPKFNDIILRENYYITLKDANGEEIPFGLNRWNADSQNGYLSFLDGFPEGFTQPVYATFYKYIGRKLNEAVITTDGQQKMLEGYQPLEDMQVTTKKYVDTLLGQTNSVVDKMLPPQPETFAGKDIEFICENSFGAFYTMTNQFYDKVMLKNEEFTLTIPMFYNPKYGDVVLEATWDNETYFVVAQINLGSEQTAGFVIDYSGDAYADSLASRGFYNGIKIHYTSSFEKMQQMFQSSLMTFRFKYTYGGETFTSNTITLGFESEQITDSFSTTYKKQFIQPTANYQTVYISGVPTPKAGSELEISRAEFYTLQQFKSNEKIASTVFTDICSFDTMPEEVYSGEGPKSELKYIATIPSDIYFEKAKMETNTFNLFGENNGNVTEEWNYRIDTVSDESHRVVSGEQVGVTVLGYGKKWDPTKNVVEMNELQMLNGKYQWPKGDYRINGTELIGTFDPAFILPGPNYDTCPEEGERFVTLQYDIDYANGVYIELIAPENVTQNKNTHAFNFSTMQIKVEGYTDWLDARAPYDGIGINSEFGQGCLAVQNSGNNCVYCTFGPKPIRGKLYVRIGIKHSDIKFAGLQITPKI